MNQLLSGVGFSNVNMNFKLKCLILGTIADGCLALPIKMKDHIIKVLNILKIVAQCELPSLVDQYSNKRHPQVDGTAPKKVKRDFDSNDEENDMDRVDGENNQSQGAQYGTVAEDQVQTKIDSDADGDDTIDIVYDFRAELLEAYSSIVMVS
jgi:hypothetical protein